MYRIKHILNKKIIFNSKRFFCDYQKPIFIVPPPGNGFMLILLTVMILDRWSSDTESK